MARRSAVEQIVIEEKTVGEALLKLIAAREKASAWHLKWAKFEEHEFLIFLFGKLAELRWIWNETIRIFYDKHQDYLKTFKDIYYEERVIEDTKKALQACEGSITKIRKQVEAAQKKGDSVKIYSLNQELNSQLAMKEHLKKKIDGHDDKMNKHKIEQIQRGLFAQAQSGLQLADQLRHLFIAQLRISDILGSSSPDHPATWQMLTQVLIGLSDTLGLYPPPSGAVDPLPSPSESPSQNKKTTSESPLPSPVPSSGTMTPTRRSFPFFRPLPTEPSESEPHPQQNGYRTRSFTRSSSDVTPNRVTKTSLSPVSSPFVSRTILEETSSQEHYDTLILSDPDRHRSKSVSQTSRKSSSPASSSPYHLTNVLNLDTSSSSLLDQIPNERGAQTKHLPPPMRDMETPPGSESDSGYADPIDALKQYYSSLQQTPDARKKISVPPYQTLEEIQRARLSQVDPDDPTYSRPYDCLRGLPGPVRISGENSTGFVMPPAQRYNVCVPERRFHRPILQGSSGSDEALSSSPSPSPSPEPREIGTSLRRSHRSGSLDHLLDPGSGIRKVPVKFKDDSLVRMRVSSEGNLLSKVRRHPSRPDILSPLALTASTASEHSSSPQPSPLHAPVPAEVTRLYNGSAKYIQHDLSISHSQ